MASVNALANLDRVRAALAKARTLPEIVKIRNLAEAARTYAKAAHMSKESLDYAAELKLSAERKAGRFLHACKSRAAGDRRKLRQALPEFLNIRRLLKRPTRRRARRDTGRRWPRFQKRRSEATS